MAKSFAPLFTTALIMGSLILPGDRAEVNERNITVDEQLPQPAAPKLVSFDNVLVRSATVYPYTSPVTLAARTYFSSITIDLGDGNTFTYRGVEGRLEMACGRIKLYFNDDEIRPLVLDKLQSQAFIENTKLDSIAGIMPVCEQ